MKGPKKAVKRRRAAPGGKRPSSVAALQRLLEARDARINALNERVAQLSGREEALREAEDRERATREVLSLISLSPGDAQPVFDAIARSARRLCGGTQAGVFIYDGELIHLSALDNVNPGATEAFRRIHPAPPSRAAATTRAILERTTITVADVTLDPEYAHAGAAQSAGMRSIVAVPMIGDGKAIGVTTVTRATPGAFPDSELELPARPPHQTE